MNNNLKSALNAAVLLLFMCLAWATSPPPHFSEIIKMEVVINADSTAFTLTNLENKDFNEANITVYKKYDSSSEYATSAFAFSKNNVQIKANQSIILPFNQFIGYDYAKKQEVVMSKNIIIERFMFSNYLRKQSGKRVYATFDFTFNLKNKEKMP